VTARVLIAEDNDSLALMLKRFLAAQGFAVTTARNGLEALQAVTAGGVDLLVLDLKLPVLSGVDLLRRLRKTPQHASLPVVVMTGAYRGQQYADAARRLGIHHYLEKPFTQGAFLSAVRAALQDHGAPRNRRLFDLLVSIYNHRESGLLSITGGPAVSFINGEPLSFPSRNRGEFPEFLVAQGKIGPDDHQQYLDSGEERIFLTQSGLLTYDELQEESRLFLVKSIMDALALDLTATFTSGQQEIQPPLIPLSLPILLYEALKGHGHRFDCDTFLGSCARLFPARTLLFYRRINLTTLRKEDIDLLERVDGRQPLQDILAGAADARSGAAFFHYLQALGMIEFHGDPHTEAVPDFPLKNLFNRPLEEMKRGEETAVDFEDLVQEVSGNVELAVGEVGMASPLSRDEIGFEQMVQREYTFIKDRNYYEIFNLTPASFSFNALKDAYFEKTRAYSPEKFMEISGATMNLAQEVLSHYANAYTTLSSVVAKERYDEMLNAESTIGLDGKQDDRLQARIQFESGSAFLAMGEFENAEKALQEAYTLDPGDPLHCALLAWAIYRNPANRNSRAALDKSRMLLGKSLQNGRCAEAFSYRGWMLLDEGRDGLAEAEFQKALKINPKEPVSVKGLKLIEEKREADKKGVFRKFFG
jgi:DNA-binding response OmpR family regulator/tetratricopeptide (TPR) repeat protein